METWYKTSGYNYAKITPTDVERSTDKFVVLPGGRKEIKISSYNCYFPTWDEAHEYLLSGAMCEVGKIRLNLERANGYLGNVKGMKKPE